MAERLRVWWQRIKMPLEVSIITICFIGLVVLIIIITLGYINNWAWAGLGSNAPSFHGKTLWDWLQLLIIPAVLAVGGYVFNLTVSRNERDAVTKRDQTERDIAQDNQREAAFQEYIDKMSELLLDRKLRESAEDDEVRKIARVRTLTVLSRLDRQHKRRVLQFLYESFLIVKDMCIIDLIGANFSNADLSQGVLFHANLNGANMRETDLRETDLLGADLTNANLSFANLCGANVTQEELNKAKSLKGATMPDGSIHP